MDQEKPQAKRPRVSVQQVTAPNAASGSQVGPIPSSTTGAKVASSPAAAAASQQAVKLSDPSPASTSAVLAPTAASTAGSAPGSSTAALSHGGNKAPSAPTAAPAAKKATGNNFFADAREAVVFRAVAAPTAESLAAEIAAGGQPVSVDFLHQHFGDTEQIRGYNGLKITIWIHVRTYHTWVDVVYAAKRPGADKLGDIFQGGFPSGYCRSQDEFVESVTRTLASLPDLTTLGECVGKVTIPTSAFGLRAAVATAAAITAAAPAEAAPGAAAAVPAPMEVDGARPGGSAGGGVGAVAEVTVRRFQVISAPQAVKDLHQRMEPLLLFTIDGAQFIDDEDPSWELLLPVVRAEDGGCLVLGLTTLFNFYSYPASCRLRVSQVLVLSPWQGLGLGKALLRLSYGLAKERGCADLTVEDPTPNLQRVREKLEVEMLRRLGWVVEQAERCFAALARGETAWPAVSLPSLSPPPPPQHQPTQQNTPAGAPQQDPQQPQSQQHPLLAAHGFFRALAAAPPEGRSLPEEVCREAATAAEERWRQKLAAAETAAAAADAAPADAAGAGAAAAGGSGDGPSRSRSGSVEAGGSDVSDVFVPSAAFVSAVSQELKMHKGQFRVVWEALLWSHPGALRRLGVRAALEKLVSRRLESQHFSSVGRAAAAKRLVDTVKTTKTAGADGVPLPPAAGSGSGSAAPGDDDPANAVTDFFMYRPLGRSARGGSGGGGEGVDVEAVATGRLNLTTVTADDKARKMSEMMAERLEQLESLAAVLNRVGRTRAPAAVITR